MSDSPSISAACPAAWDRVYPMSHDCRCSRQGQHEAHACPCGAAWRFCPDCGTPFGADECPRCGYTFTLDGEPGSALEAM